MTNSFLSHAIGCQEASQMLGSSQLSVHLAAPAIRRALDDQDNEHTFWGKETSMGRKVLLNQRLLEAA